MKIVAHLLTLLIAVPVIVLAGGDDDDCKTIYEIVKKSSKFDTLETALKLAGLDDELDDKDAEFTVFAPTDRAFKRLPDGTLDALVANEDALRDILLYHVVDGKTKSEDLSDGQKIETLVGRKVEVDENSHRIKINKSRVIKADVKACNGVIHVINRVLIPKIKKDDDCKDDNDCGFCVGDCNNDHDCEGDRDCIKREKGENEDVPFCLGGDRDSSGTDYCSWK